MSWSASICVRSNSQLDSARAHDSGEDSVFTAPFQRERALFRNPKECLPTTNPLIMDFNGQYTHTIEPLFGPKGQNFQLGPFNIHLEQVHPLPAEVAQ